MLSSFPLYYKWASFDNFNVPSPYSYHIDIDCMQPSLDDHYLSILKEWTGEVLDLWLLYVIFIELELSQLMGNMTQPWGENSTHKKHHHIKLPNHDKTETYREIIKNANYFDFLFVSNNIYPVKWLIMFNDICQAIYLY